MGAVAFFLIAIIALSAIIGLIFIISGIIIRIAGKRKAIFFIFLIIGIIFCFPAGCSLALNGVISVSDNIKKNKQMGPFLRAIKRNNIKLINKMIKEDPKIVNLVNENYKSTTPLIMAVNHNKEKVINILIKNNADLNLPGGPENITPLMTAVRNDNVKITELLLQLGADINHIQSDYNAIFYASLYSYNPDIITLLVSNNADINFINKRRNYTPLIEIIIRPDYRHGTDEMTLFKKSSFNPSRNKFAETIIDAGADLKLKDDEGNTALHKAVQNYNLLITKMILSKYKNINVKNSDGQTPLIYFSKWSSIEGTNMDKRLEILKLLLDNGSDIYVKDVKNKSAMDYLSSKEYTKDLLKYIQEYE